MGMRHEMPMRNHVPTLRVQVPCASGKLKRGDKREASLPWVAGPLSLCKMHCALSFIYSITSEILLQETKHHNQASHTVFLVSQCL